MDDCGPTERLDRLRIRGGLRLLAALVAALLGFAAYAQAQGHPSVGDDPLVRMPGSQPGDVALEASDRCFNCHSDYDPAVEPGSHWEGSMMAQAMRDPLFWATMTVAAQDSMWALDGNPNATDLCLRCHTPSGWLEGRSDPPNATAVAGSDFDGVSCDFCHRMWDPFAPATHDGTREGADWQGYWDETNVSDTPSQPAADATLLADQQAAEVLEFFNGTEFFDPDSVLPLPPDYDEATSGQYFVSSDSAKRGPFADAEPRHHTEYSRFHKSVYFCATCHDVSNPVLANLAFAGTIPGDGTTVLPSEAASAGSYFHVERTFSEFMLSSYGLPGGAPGSGAYAPDLFETSHSGNYIATCQDCHMGDAVGAGADKNGAPVRPGESVEHPNSGQPVHDLTGGNVWVPTILASSVPGSPNYNAANDTLLNQGSAALTLDLTAGLGLDPEALLSAADRARQQLTQAATITDATYDPTTGEVAFRVNNHTGHKLISGFPEGRRMFVNIVARDSAEDVLYEVNPYDDTASTLKGLPRSPNSPPLSQGESYVDELVYELHPSSSLTGESETFHFVLADGRYKDNRIPPRGFRIEEASDRMSVPAWHGVEDPDLYTDSEYAGGYDDVALMIGPGAATVEISLYYQTTSREYVEFLRDEINGTGSLTLDASAYVAQSDPYFGQLAAWGDTIWQLWLNNKDLDGAEPILMTETEVEGGSAESRIGDLVWQDADGDGIHEPGVGETGVDGIAVELWNASRTEMMASTVSGTTGAGGYEFAASPGTYWVRVVSPGYQSFTTQKVGIDDSVDSDADAEGWLGPITAEPGEVDDQWDAGFVPLVPVDVVSVPDWDGVGGDEVGVLLFDSFASRYSVVLRDEASGSLAAALPVPAVYEALDVEATPAGGVAVLARRLSDSQVRVRVFSPTGGFSDYLFGTGDTAVDLAVTPAGDLAVLGERVGDGMIRVRVLEDPGGASQQLVALLYGKAFTPDVLQVTPSGALAVLGHRDTDGQIRVRVVDPAGGSGNFLYGKVFTSTDLAVSTDGHLAVLGTRGSDSLVRVQVIDPLSAGRTNYFYGSDFTGDDVELIGGVDPAVLGTNSGNNQVRVKVTDAVTRIPIATYLQGVSYSGIDLEETITGALAVLGKSPTTGVTRVRVNDTYDIPY